jgi:hypothetical protein
MLNRQQREAEIRQVVKHPQRSPYFALLSDVPKGQHYADGEKIYIANGANWDIYVFHRTGFVKPDAGEWLLVGTTSGAGSW